MEHIGFLGLGWMGGHFAARLRQAGVPLMVFDTLSEKMRPLLELGAGAGESAAALAATCDVLLLSLPDSEISAAVIERDLLPAARPGQILVDLGTTRIDSTRRICSTRSHQTEPAVVLRTLGIVQGRTHLDPLRLSSAMASPDSPAVE